MYGIRKHRKNRNLTVNSQKEEFHNWNLNRPLQGDSHSSLVFFSQQDWFEKNLGSTNRGAYTGLWRYPEHNDSWRAWEVPGKCAMRAKRCCMMLPLVSCCHSQFGVRNLKFSRQRCYTLCSWPLTRSLYSRKWRDILHAGGYILLYIYY